MTRIIKVEGAKGGERDLQNNGELSHAEGRKETQFLALVIRTHNRQSNYHELQREGGREGERLSACKYS